jgi:hypothetical protein
MFISGSVPASFPFARFVGFKPLGASLSTARLKPGPSTRTQFSRRALKLCGPKRIGKIVGKKHCNCDETLLWEC